MLIEHVRVCMTPRMIGGSQENTVLCLVQLLFVYVEIPRAMEPASLHAATVGILSVEDRSGHPH